MFTKERFLEMMGAARNVQNDLPQEIDIFFKFAKNYVEALEDRKQHAQNRAHAALTRAQSESAHALNLQSQLNERESDFIRLKFKNIVHRAVAKDMQEKHCIDEVVKSAQLYAVESNLDKALVSKAKVDERLSTVKNDLDEALVSKAKVDERLSTVKNNLDEALVSKAKVEQRFEVLSQQNETLQSRVSEMEKVLDKPNVMNFTCWGKTQWTSFAVGVVVGEQIVEQYTSYKPVRNTICRCAKKLLGKTGKPSYSLPPELLPEETVKTHTAVVSIEPVKVVSPHTGV